MALDVRMSPLGPVAFVGAGTVEALATVRAHGGIMQLPADDLPAASVWIAKGQDWHGPFCPETALAALEALCPAYLLGDVRKALEAGLSSELGAALVAGGWRYRLVWGNDFPPERFNGSLGLGN